MKFIGIIPARYASTRFQANHWLCWAASLSYSMFMKKFPLLRGSLCRNRRHPHL